MRMPESLAALVDYGIIQEVVRPLMSGKEAQIYLVVSGGEERVAKVYKEAQSRTFKHRAEYTEGRKTRNSRDQRAINKRTRYGRSQDEAAWRSTEVDMIRRLRDAGVRVPEPFHFVDGVLVMELIKDAAGNPAPRLGDLSLEAGEAIVVYDTLIGEVVRMLCAGVVHGDLSEFNVMLGRFGPCHDRLPAVRRSGEQSERPASVVARRGESTQLPRAPRAPSQAAAIRRRDVAALSGEPTDSDDQAGRRIQGARGQGRYERGADLDRGGG